MNLRHRASVPWEVDMAAMTNRFHQTIFLDAAIHEIIFTWNTDTSGAVMEVLKVSREDIELRGIALLNFWSMLNIDKTLGVTVIPNIHTEGDYDLR
jgi:hypothetical protein